MSITIYGASLSPFVRKVRLALAIKQIEYELVPVIPMSPDQPAEFVANSPLRKIPLAHIDGNWIPDSSVILGYLERTRPTPALLPQDPALAARAEWFEEYADSKMVLAIGAHMFFEIVLAPNLLGRETDQTIVETAKTKELPEIFDYLESQLDGDFLVGDSMGHADICVCSHFINMRYCGVDCDAARWPKTAAYIERITGDAVFASVLEDEQAFVEALGL